MYPAVFALGVGIVLVIACIFELVCKWRGADPTKEWLPVSFSACIVFPGYLIGDALFGPVWAWAGVPLFLNVVIVAALCQIGVESWLERQRRVNG